MNKIPSMEKYIRSLYVKTRTCTIFLICQIEKTEIYGKEVEVIVRKAKKERNNLKYLKIILETNTNVHFIP